MTLVLDIFRQHLPHKAKATPSGWTSFNAPCCHHRGHSADTRQRGGVIYKDGMVYNCFNCGYTASWKPGRPISQKLKNLMRWMGAPEDDINKMVFEAMKTEATDEEYKPQELKTFTEKELPEGTLEISEWIEQELPQDLEQQLANVVQYVINRGFDPRAKEFMWTPVEGFNDRVIIPFTYQGKVVGWTARKIKEGKPKYISDQHPGYVFNLDNIDPDQQYVFVVEGPFDALAINGVAVLHNEISEQQARLINKLGKTVIVIPDQDKAGQAMVKAAIEYEWHVAFPNWETDVKDAASAVEKYGSLFVVIDAINTSVAGTIKINMYNKKLEKALKNSALAASQ
jgi:hypothetical protein